MKYFICGLAFLGGSVWAAGLSQSEVRTVIKAKNTDIQSCYELELKKSAPIAGQIYLQFKILPTGVVSNPSLSTPGYAFANFTNCLKPKMEMWKFPAGKNNEPTTVRYPYTLGSAKTVKN